MTQVSRGGGHSHNDPGEQGRGGTPIMTQVSRGGGHSHNDPGEQGRGALP